MFDICFKAKKKIGWKVEFSTSRDYTLYVTLRLIIVNIHVESEGSAKACVDFRTTFLFFSKQISRWEEKWAGK